ncbi:hypothetical protein P171DRAFT_493874 [Karstenula rhodostoma CBS 690.94]|uniref:Heterokaryon incompatibility domain-containing protein n=1 Tax=Karstenula rhodostoma CBS 690.94 TaxID=1392251 RepID=A0A9P4PXR0_9PLEO|nr:hypothetical protein P171DRAFT_493874 [Karstenula rhodostoma CBS 690.94]
MAGTAESADEPGAIYGPLDSATPHIRLLRLLKGRHDDPVSGELFQVALNQTPEVKYEALSYIWGNQELAHQIHVNGQPLNIGEILYSALYTLREMDKDRILWIDAICINRHDDSEVSHQIRLMGDIYQRSQDVIVYLGPETPEYKLVLEYMHQLEKVLDERGYAKLPVPDEESKDS